MAEHDLIDAYLAHLRASVASLSYADDIVDEAADHLLTTVESLTATGVPRAQAERTALDRYGPARTVGRAFVEQHRRRGAVATARTRRAGVYALVTAAAGVVVKLLQGTGVLRGLVHLVLAVAFFGTWVQAMKGIRARHGTIAPWGRRAIRLALASPVIGLVFVIAFQSEYAGVPAVELPVDLAFACVAVGLFRARILPAAAVALWLLAPLPLDVLKHVGLGGELLDTVDLLANTAGLGWIGWALWREPALDEDHSDLISA